MANRHKLSREIPASVKRQVRQRCGFGCVVCASAIIDYEHFDPEFVDAHEHNPAGITLLCPSCHAKKTRGFMSAGRVKEANLNPAALQIRYAYSETEGTTRRPFIKFAGLTLRNCEIPILLSGYPVFQIEDAEEEGGPYLLSGSFFDKAGRPSLMIVRNEWKVLTESWDVEASGGTVTDRTDPSDVALRLAFCPGEGLVVERLEMLCAGFRISGNADVLRVYSPHGGCFEFTKSLADGVKVGLSFG
jgi:hypothetical protein